MGENTHTPLPWGLRNEDYDWEVYPLRNGPPDVGVWSAVATCHDQYDEGDEAKANAELIVAAVNSHAAKSAEIERLRANLQYIATQWPDSSAAKHARAALKEKDHA